MKYCKYCDTNLPLNQFYKRAKSPDGFGYKCIYCQKKYNKERWANDPEHREKSIRKAYEWAKENPAKRKASVLAYDNKTRDVKQARERARAKERRQIDPDGERLKGRIAAHKRKQRVLNNNSAPHPGFVERILLRAKGRCTYCEKIVEKLTLDHFHPVSKGGDGTCWNIVPCCGSCNSSKKDRDGCEWIEKRFGIERLVSVYWRIESLSAARLP